MLIVFCWLVIASFTFHYHYLSCYAHLKSLDDKMNYNDS